MRTWLSLAALLGFLCVALGAFAAHGLADPQAQAWMRTGAEYGFVHVLASRSDPDLVGRLQAHIDLQQSYLDRKDRYQDFFAADFAFHRDMHEAAGVAALWELEQRHSGHVDRLRRLHLPEAGKAKRIVRDHQRILDAIAAQDVPLAQEALREHLSGTLNQIDEICRRYPDYVTGMRNPA